jgi:nucleoside-diphosphate-sugar epimerase
MDEAMESTKTIIPKRIVITGATGFLGFRAARALSDRGHDVLGLGRNVAIGRELERHGIPFVRCELSDVNRLHKSFRGFDVVVHCAALTRSGAAAEEYRLANFIGTRNVMTAMQETSVRRWVHLSTARLYGGRETQIAVRENEPLVPYCEDPYLESKRLNEIDIDNYVAVPSIILRPMLIFGPGDRRLYPYLRRLAGWRRLPGYDEGRTMIDPVYVDNVVDAIVGAVRAEDRAEGHAYNLSNREPVNAHAFLTSLAETSGNLVQPLKLRSGRALKFALFLEALYRFFGAASETPLPSTYVRMFSESLTLNCDAAEHDLGYRPKVTLRQAMTIMNGMRRRI